MEDKIIMNTSLTLAKNMCDILMHGAIESSTSKIKTTFIKSLSEYLNLQGSIYKAMEEAGLYKMETIENSKISEACSKHEPSLN